MRLRCYINRKQFVSNTQFNPITTSTLKSNCSNKILLKVEPSTEGILDPSPNFGASCIAMSRSHEKEEKKSANRRQESIATGSNILINSNRVTNSNYNYQNYSLPNNYYTKFYRSYSELNVWHSDLCPPSGSNYSALVNCNQFRMRRSDSELSNQTRVVEEDFRRANKLRGWEVTSAEKWLHNSTTCMFSLMSYNVLAQKLLTEHSYLYKNHSPRVLSWEHRWNCLLKEIKQHNADILCLQEVQESHLNDYFNELHDLGYRGIFKKRTGIRTDGCAIYYKTSKFNLVEHTTVEFNQSQVFVLDRDNVAIIAKFSSKDNPKSEFVVATTHLLYNPRREDVRLAQTQVLLTEVDRISYKHITDNGSSHSHLPIIITGDFNFKPDSAVYKLIVNGQLEYEKLSNRSLTLTSTTKNNTKTGKLLLPSFLKITDNCQHADLVEHRQASNNTLKREEELKLIQLQHSERKPLTKCAGTNDRSIFSTGTLSHHLALKSAYNHKQKDDMEATTYQNEWITVDYIFYSGQKDEHNLIHENKLKLISRYSIPVTNQLKDIRIPNYVFGSDHLSLVVKFKLEP